MIYLPVGAQVQGLGNAHPEVEAQCTEVERHGQETQPGNSALPVEEIDPAARFSHGHSCPRFVLC